MRRRMLIAVSLVATAACLVGLAVGVGLFDDRAFTSTDSWYNPAPGSFHFTGNGRPVAPVVEERQPEAQELLSEVSAKELTEDEAERLIGKRLNGEGVCVLLRAVVLNEGNGAYSVHTRSVNVSVFHGCLGRRPVPMKRKAIVARLPEVPKTVYVSCGMAA